MEETLSQLGEREVLDRLRKFMPPGQIDDDTALIREKNKELIVNTDLLVDGTHFSQITTSPEDVGWKAIATNLSDLASSGVDEILGITVGLVAPASTEWSWVEGVYSGMKEALDFYGGQLIGGDCSQGKEKVLAITAIGSQGKIRLHRGNALPGDWLIATGSHGLSRLGLALLQSETMIDNRLIPSELKSLAIKAHQRPEPPLEAIKALKNCKPSNISSRAAGTDSSDGLLRAIESICDSSNCQAVIEETQLPRHKDWPSGSQWNSWCLNGGEDFELVVSLPASWAKAFLRCWPSSKCIGKMENGSSKVLWGNKNEIKEDNEFHHFSS